MTVLLESKQKNIMVRKFGKLQFKLKFKDKPIEVEDTIAEYLTKQSPDNFKVVGKVKAKRDLSKKDKQRVQDYTDDLQDDGKRNYSNKEGEKK